MVDGREVCFMEYWGRNLSCHIYDNSSWYFFLYVLASDSLEVKVGIFSSFFHSFLSPPSFSFLPSFLLSSFLPLSLSLPTWVLESSCQVLREPKKCTREVQESIHVDILAEADSQHRCQTHKNAFSRTPVPVTI